ncbi:MAG TPA: Gfo/Idh/MocA family oxidoreductase [Planctomycetaceae bacterium]|nr:Gfo/Idh/MocA family oxidoreductase [Planctomycetaceae bacterium]
MTSVAPTVRAADEPPVSVAVIGTGARGCDLIRALTTIDNVRIGGVCDSYGLHRERGWQYAGPLAKAVDDPLRLLDEPKLQAVVIATPPATHVEFCLAAMERGLAVYCEKTLGSSRADAVRIADAAEKHGTVFQVGLQRRANAIYRQAAAMVQTGMLGRVTAIKCQWNRHHDWRRPVPVARNHPDFADYDRQLNWKLYRATSQGLLGELGSHQLDVANWVLGTPPKSVIGVGGIDYWKDGREVFDNVSCIYDYEVTPPPAKRGSPLPPGVTADPYTVRVTYSSLQNNAYEGASELILGTHGTLLLTDKKGWLYREAVPEEIAWSPRAEQQAAIVASGKTLKLSNDPFAHRGTPFEIEATGDDTRDALVSFLDHVRQGDRQTLCTVQDGVLNTTTVEIGNLAMDRGARIGFPS